MSQTTALTGAPPSAPQPQAQPGPQPPATASGQVDAPPAPPAPVPPAPVQRTDAAATQTPGEAAPARVTGVKVHTAHYVVAPGMEEGDASAPDGAEPITIVTGEVPAGYSRIAIECQHGVVVEATVLAPRSPGGVVYFAALAPSRVQRVVATKGGGAYGIFLDVDRLSELDAKAES